VNRFNAEVGITIPEDNFYISHFFKLERAKKYTNLYDAQAKYNNNNNIAFFPKQVGVG